MIFDLIWLEIVKINQKSHLLLGFLSQHKTKAGEFPPKRQYLCQYCDFKTHCDEEGFIT